VLAELAKIAVGEVRTDFVDPQLHFYSKHALQWLLFALRRGAQMSPVAIASFHPLLRKMVDPANEHILLRGLAADTLRILANANAVILSDVDARALAAINESRLPPVADDSFASRHRREPRPSTASRFLFDYDFRGHAIDPLARCFGLSSGDLERAAASVIRDDWGLSFDGSWKTDVRAQREYFRHHSRERYDGAVKRDTLSHYLSHHALLVAAGRLLATHPLRSNPDSLWTSFSGWLRRQDLTFGANGWLADRRDAIPLTSAGRPAIHVSPSTDASVLEDALRSLATRTVTW
jgi:hypothetical protein